MEKMMEQMGSTTIPMEKMMEQMGSTTISDTKAPQNQLSASNRASSVSIILKPATPDRLKLPKAFKYPERYTSPTDLIMSPISRELVARTRKTMVPLPLNFKKSPKCALPTSRLTSAYPELTILRE